VYHLGNNRVSATSFGHSCYGNCYARGNIDYFVSLYILAADLHITAQPHTERQTEQTMFKYDICHTSYDHCARDGGFVRLSQLYFGVQAVYLQT
jgi:hypothetical protein